MRRATKLSTRVTGTIAAVSVLLLLFACIAPATFAADAQRGEELFWGGGFERGAPSCASCHTLEGADALAGGRFGPDLTAAGDFYGADGLAAWLSAPSSKTMTPLFAKGSGGELTEEESAALGAYLAQVSKEHPKVTAITAPGYDVRVTALALAGAIVLMLLGAVIWRRRHRRVRHDIVSASKLARKRP